MGYPWRRSWSGFISAVTAGLVLSTPLQTVGLGINFLESFNPHFWCSDQTVGFQKIFGLLLIHLIYFFDFEWIWEKLFLLFHFGQHQPFFGPRWALSILAGLLDGFKCVHVEFNFFLFKCLDWVLGWENEVPTSLIWHRLVQLWLIDYHTSWQIRVIHRVLFLI